MLYKIIVIALELFRKYVAIASLAYENILYAVFQQRMVEHQHGLAVQLLYPFVIRPLRPEHIYGLVHHYLSAPSVNAERKQLL